MIRGAERLVLFALLMAWALSACTGPWSKPAPCPCQQSTSQPRGSNPEIERQDDRLVTIAAGGDILLDRGVKTTALLAGDPYYPLSTLHELFGSADVTIANLEGALTAADTPYAKRYIFKADPSYAGLLKKAGLNILSLANNHSYDYGRDALLETARHLEQAGILALGAGENLDAALSPRYLTIKNIRIALIGVVTMQLEGLTWRPEAPNPGLAVEELVVKKIQDAKTQADFVILSVHWGNEFAPEANADQLRWAQIFRRAGADVVFGHHPHVIQPIEEINGRWVFYSLGNFVFDQTRPEQRQALLARLEITKRGIQSVSAIPLTINDARPMPADEASIADILERLKKYSSNLEFTREGGLIRCAPKR